MSKILMCTNEEPKAEDIHNTNAKNALQPKNNINIDKSHIDINKLGSYDEIVVRSAEWCSDNDEFFIIHKFYVRPYERLFLNHYINSLRTKDFGPCSPFDNPYTLRGQFPKYVPLNQWDNVEKTYWIRENVEFDDLRFNDEETLDLIGHYRHDLFEKILNYYAIFVSHVSRHKLRDNEKKLWRPVVEYETDKDLIKQWTWDRDIVPNLTHFSAILTHRLYTWLGIRRTEVRELFNEYKKALEKFLLLPKTIKKKPEYVLHTDDELDMLQFKKPELFDKVVEAFTQIIPLTENDILRLKSAATKPQRTFNFEDPFYVNATWARDILPVIDKYHSLLLKRAIRISIPIPNNEKTEVAIIKMELRGYEQSTTLVIRPYSDNLHNTVPDALDFLQYYRSDLFFPLLDHYCKTKKLSTKVQTKMINDGLRIRGAKYDYEEEKIRKTNDRTWQSDIVPFLEFYFNFLFQREHGGYYYTWKI